jgi:hypothetical protein
MRSEQLVFGALVWEGSWGSCSLIFSVAHFRGCTFRQSRAIIPVWAAVPKQATRGGVLIL